MKFGRFRLDGVPRWGIIDGTTVQVAPASIGFDEVVRSRALLASVARDSHEMVPFEGLQWLAPVSSPPQFIGVGMNYHDHAREVEAALPRQPITFGFYPNAVVGPGQNIELPPLTAEVDWEVELAVVIGMGGRNIPIDEALDAVAGYTIVNDVSARDIQFAEGQWSRAKSFDSFKPMGPWVVSTDELGDGSGLGLSLWVNGVLKQNSNTDHLIFDIPYLVSHISKSLTLLPGAVIATGTPGGVGFTRTPPEYLRAGDLVELEIDGIGRLANEVVASSPR